MKNNFIGISGHSSVHHIVPTSIGGTNNSWNRYRWTVERHQSWHKLFYNYLPSTCISLIEDWTDESRQLGRNKIWGARRKIWGEVFGKKSPSEAIRHIRKKFLPAELKFIRNKIKNDKKSKGGSK